MFAGDEEGAAGELSVRARATRGRTLLWSACGGTRELRASALHEQLL
jgi:hypothetical protein